MSQELIKTLRWLSDYDNNDFVFCANTCMQAADTIQYLLDGADEVNKELQEQIEENERLKAELEAAIKDIMCLDHCDVCVHSREGNCSCEAAGFNCLVCKDENCTCRGCRDENKWQWRGVERRI